MLKAAGSVKKHPAAREAGRGRQRGKAALDAQTGISRSPFSPTTSPYDGKTSLATYAGSARLFQVGTTIRGDQMTIDESRGDLTASGHAMTSTIRRTGRQRKEEKSEVQSTGTSNDLEATRTARGRMTYTGAARLVGPEGDMSAARRSSCAQYVRRRRRSRRVRIRPRRPPTSSRSANINRTTTGARDDVHWRERANLTWVTGVPATVIDECGRETTGKIALTFGQSPPIPSSPTAIADPHADQGRQRQSVRSALTMSTLRTR